MNEAHPDASQSPLVVTVVAGPQAFHGYLWGIRQPSLQYTVKVGAANQDGLRELDTLLARIIGPGPAALAREGPGDPVLDRLLSWTTAILQARSHPVFQPARVSESARADGKLHLIQQPCFDHAATAVTVDFVISSINALARREASADADKQIASDLERLLAQLQRSGPRGFNQLWFLNAAHELNVPWARLVGDVFLYGWGSRGRWLESSFTDRSSNIGAKLARSKPAAAAMLRLNGVPVPEHAEVKSEEEAIRYAEKIGYPVVVKPADLDGGRGVAVDLRDAAMVRDAYAGAAALSKHILVEKHVDGRDFRIQVFDGVVQGLLERVPGGVVGNGADPVSTLLERQNRDRKLATDDRRFLHAIAVDKEAHAQLVAQGLDWHSTPRSGQFVRLRSASNVTSGGVPTPLPLDHAHPDNLSLAIRAARALRLDAAGVDLLIPDIGRSWLEGGAFVCEVNGQPQMFTTMHKPMLAALLAGTDGRIPVAIVIGDSAGEGAGARLHRALLAMGVRAGMVHGANVRAGDETVSTRSGGFFAGARMLCNDPAVEAMVLCVSEANELRQGWPVDRCDLLVLETAPPSTAMADSRPPDAFAWLRFAAPLSPRRVIVDDAQSSLLAGARALFGPSAIVESAGLSRGTQFESTAVDLMVPQRRPLQGPRP